MEHFEDNSVFNNPGEHTEELSEVVISRDDVNLPVEEDVVSDSDDQDVMQVFVANWVSEEIPEEFKDPEDLKPIVLEEEPPEVEPVTLPASLADPEVEGTEGYSEEEENDDSEDHRIRPEG